MATKTTAERLAAIEKKLGMKSGSSAAKKTTKKKASGGSNKGTAKLKKITSKAKELRKKSPSMEWKAAIKKASKMV